MKNRILFTFLLSLWFALTLNAQSNDKRAVFQKLQGEWHTTQTTQEGQKIDFKWIFTLGFSENVMEFQSWIKQNNDLEWKQNVQALYIYDPKSDTFYAVGTNTRGLAQRVAAHISGENEIVFKYYEIRPDAPLRMESRCAIFEDRFESQTDVYENGIASENEKLTFYKK